MKRIILILTLVFCISDLLATPNSSQNIEELNSRIKEDVARLEKKQKELEEKVEKYDSLYQNGVNIIWIVTGIITVLGFGGYFSFESFKKKTKETYDSIIKNHSETLSQIFAEAMKENNLKETTKIGVVNLTGKEDSNIKHLLSINNFSKISFLKFDTSINASDYQVLIFMEDIDIRDVESYIKNSQKTVKYFHFGGKFFSEDLAKSFEYKVSSSKFPSQLIGNIMNLLKYN